MSDEGTVVEFGELAPEKARCLINYGCFVAALPRDESIPVGQTVIVIVDGERMKTIVVAVQQGTRGEGDLYILVDQSQVQVREVPPPADESAG